MNVARARERCPRTACWKEVETHHWHITVTAAEGKIHCGVLTVRETKEKWSICTALCVCLVTQSCPTLCDPSDRSPPGSSTHGIFQEKMLEWVAISFSRGSSQPRDLTLIFCISCIGRWILYHCTTWEAPTLLIKINRSVLL